MRRSLQAILRESQQTVPFRQLRRSSENKARNLPFDVHFNKELDARTAINEGMQDLYTPERTLPIVPPVALDMGALYEEATEQNQTQEENLAWREHIGHIGNKAREEAVAWGRKHQGEIYRAELAREDVDEAITALRYEQQTAEAANVEYVQPLTTLVNLKPYHSFSLRHRLDGGKHAKKRYEEHARGRKEKGQYMKKRDAHVDDSTAKELPMEHPETAWEQNMHLLGETSIDNQVRISLASDGQFGRHALHIASNRDARLNSIYARHNVENVEARLATYVAACTQPSATGVVQEIQKYFLLDAVASDKLDDLPFKHYANLSRLTEADNDGRSRVGSSLKRKDDAELNGYESGHLVEHFYEMGHH